jgi:hypothetical protein
LAGNDFYFFLDLIALFQKKNFNFSIVISAEEHERLEHHISRLGWNKVEVIRHALHNRLNELDEQETFMRANREANRKTRGPKIGHVPVANPADETNGKFTIPVAPTFTPKEEEPLIRKFQKDLDRWANLVERAENDSDRTIRLRMIEDDMIQRGGTPDDCQKGMIALHEKLKLRADALRMLPKIVKAPPGIPIAGDID